MHDDTAAPAATRAVGREAQREELRRLIGAIVARSAQANVLFVTGEAGIGKSTLLAMLPEIVGELPGGLLVETVACSTPVAGRDIGQMEALSPWAELMSRLTADTTAKRHGSGKLVAELAAAWIPCLPVVGDVFASLISTSQ